MLFRPFVRNPKCVFAAHSQSSAPGHQSLQAFQEFLTGDSHPQLKNSGLAVSTCEWCLLKGSAGTFIY